MRSRSRRPALNLALKLGGLALSALVGPLVGSPARAEAAQADLRLELGPAYDSNVLRLEGGARQAPLGDGLLLGIGELQVARSVGERLRLQAAWQAGGKLFAEQAGEDTLAQRLDVGLGFVLPSPEGTSFRLLVDGAARHQRTRQPASSSDHTRLTATPSLDLGFRSLGATAGLALDRLQFVDHPDLNAQSYVGQAALRAGFDSLGVSLGGAIGQRGFDGPRQIRIGTTQRGVPIVDTDEGVRRADDLVRAQAGLRYDDLLIGRIDLAYERARSNSLGGDYVRKALTAQATAPLPAELIVSVSATLQDLAYAEPQFVEEGASFGVVEDEGRSSINLRLERPVSGPLSVVLRSGAWFSASGDGPSYSRTLTSLALAFGSEAAD